MRVGVVAHTDNPEAIAFAREILKFLPRADIVLERGLAEELGEGGEPIRRMRADAIVTIGGDGTVLYAQQQAPDIPILGINMGGVGFLADVPPEEAGPALKEMLAGKLQIQRRTKLAIEAAGRRLPDALNEAVVSSANIGKTLAFRVLVDGEVAWDTRGDGVIVATPTGSTAYALVAGGSALDPRLDALTVVPVCTFRPRAQPMVVPATSRIGVELTRQGRDAIVVIDGQRRVKVKAGAELSFYRSEKPALFFKWGDKFYSKIREELL